MGFFQSFSFDTLLALISCLASVIALFVGGKAYHNYRINKNHYESNIKVDNSEEDNSINISGDCYSQGISEQTLLTVIDSMSNLTSSTFYSALNNAYDIFQRKCDENLHRIMDETQRIISEQKISISGYSKLDWIHIYFESAKNASDIFMQQIWAKVLAKELSEPNSFCYKTLDVLKNMSENEFKLFEFLCSASINNGTIVKGDYLDNFGLNWICLQKLREYGVISLNDSQQQISIDPNEQTLQIINNKYVLLFKNQTNEQLDFHFQCYMLTNAATELLSIVSIETDEQLAVQITSEIKKSISDNCIITLHEINYFYDNGEKLNYKIEDLLQKATKK